MAAIEYQVSDLIEINELARELTTPNDVTEERFGGVGLSVMMDLQDALRQRRLRVVQVILDGQGRVAEQIPMDTAALAEGTLPALHDRMQSTLPGRALFCTFATVAEIWPRLASVEVWRAREAPSAPGANRQENRRLPTIAQIDPRMVRELGEHLATKGPLNEDEARAEANMFLGARIGRHVSREFFRELDRTTLERPKRRVGQRGQEIDDQA
jgi:hypothetical protein